MGAGAYAHGFPKANAGCGYNFPLMMQSAAGIGAFSLQEQSMQNLWAYHQASSLEQKPIETGRPHKVCFAEEAELIEIACWKEASRPVSAFEEDEKWRQRLLSLLESGEDEARMLALACLDGAVFELALTPTGSDALCLALEVAKPGEEQMELVQQIHGHVRELVVSPYGCEVLQCLLEDLAPKASQFVMDELLGAGLAVACREHGHQVLCRLLEFLPRANTEPMVAELLVNPVALCQNEYGSYVAMHIIEHGSAAQQHQVCQVLSQNLAHFTGLASGQRVIESACLFACPAGRSLLP